MDQGHTHRRLAMPGRRLLRASDGRPVATSTRTHAHRTGRADGRPAAALAELRTCGSVARDGLWIRAIHTVVWQCQGAGCSAHLMAARWRPARACTHLDPIRVSSLSTVTSHQLLAARSPIPFARYHPHHLRSTTTCTTHGQPLAHCGMGCATRSHAGSDHPLIIMHRV